MKHLCRTIKIFAAWEEKLITNNYKLLQDPHILFFWTLPKTSTNKLTPIENYVVLGAKYWTQLIDGGGVCIFKHKDMKFSTINLHEFCEDKHFDVYIIPLELLYTKMLVINTLQVSFRQFSVIS